MLDTYLSAQHFSGPGLTFVYTAERERPENQWSTMVTHEANFSSVNDKADSNSEAEGAYNFYWGKFYRWQLLDNHLTLQAGLQGMVSLGFIYNSSNTNNPVQVRAHINIMPAAVAKYRFRLWRKTMVARYEASVPLCGAMLVPDYGQSYFEMYGQDTNERNMVFTTPFNAPEWRQMVTIDAELSGSITLRLGYLGNYQQYDVNNLKQHVYTNRAMIGLTKRFRIEKLRM